MNYFWLLCLGLILVFGLLLLAGISYQVLATARDSRLYPPPGKLIQVGSSRLHLQRSGQGSPAVVMDYGIGGLSPLWSLVQPEVAKFTQVCIYDRAGYGWSDVSKQSRTSQQMVEELHTLLARAGVASPYILVGHSLGGLNMRLFASLYPDEVAGVVLVDSVPTEVFTHLSPIFKQHLAGVQKLFANLSILSRFGLVRMGGKKSLPDFAKKLPSEAQSLLLSQFLPHTFATSLAESQLLEESLAQVKKFPFPQQIPLVVLCHGQRMFTNFAEPKIEQAEASWLSLQLETSRLSSSGNFQVAKNSGHNIHLEEPQLVIQAIQQMLKLCESNPL